jgi:hypothetical protein
MNAPSPSTTEMEPPAQMRKGPSCPAIAPKLMIALLVKALVEISLLVILASLSTWATFPPGIRGAIDEASSEEVAGWAVDAANPRRAVVVQIFLDGDLIASRVANAVRPDLVTARVSPTPNHGFSFRLSERPLRPGPHEVEVFVLHSAPGGKRVLLPLSDRPRSFWVDR